MVRKYNYRYQNPSKNPFSLDDMDRGRDSIHSVPVWIGFLAIVGLWGIFGLVYLADRILPTPLSINDEEANPNSFISERAVADLKYLTDLGPKVTGSYQNEHAVIEFLTIKVNSIVSEAHPSQLIEFDIQSATGGYYLDDLAGYMNVYDRVQNVIVKLHGENNGSEHSILVNCHFDSVPSSPGGSDDGINVAIMLEVLRKLSQSDTRQMHNVIFLFNGAEETPLQAAHGYIAHHKWARESKILVNLEAAGAGGKMILFQTGPATSWLLKYYSKVLHPYGCVSAEELFQSGLIPSDTDFRIFRDFGNMVGLDFAYFRDGYRYHTKYDDISNIPMGSYQHGGDNTLSLIKNLANAPEVLEKEKSSGRSVFFDVFGWFMLSYTNQTAIIVNSVTILLSFGVFLLSIQSFRAGTTKVTLKFFMFTLLAIIFSWIITIIFVIATACILDYLNKTMSWYGTPWFVFGLYVCPCLSLSGCLMFFTNHKNLSLGVRSQMQAHLLRIILTFFMILGTLFNIRTTYILVLPVLFGSVGFLVIHLFKLQHTVTTWKIVHIASLVFPMAYVVYQAWISLLTFIPIAGRLGSEANPELFIGFLCMLFTLLAGSSLTVLSNLLRRGVWFHLTLLAVFLIFFGLLFTPIGFPYSGDEDSPRPQRHWIMHTQRRFFNENLSLNRTDSGIIMLNMDRNSPNILKSHVKELNNVESIEEDCARYTLCAIPLIHPKVIKKIQYSTWIPTSPPEFPDNETLTLSVISKEILSPTLVKYRIQVTGPDKLIFYITPKSNTKFVSTSLIDVVNPTKFTFQDRPIYVILYQLGKGDGTPLVFDFTMEIMKNYEGPTVDLAVSGRYVHEKRVQKTGAYLEYLSQFPKWAHVISWVASYQTYVM